MGLFYKFKQLFANSDSEVQDTTNSIPQWTKDKVPTFTDIAMFVVLAQECNAANIQRHFNIGIRTVNNYLNQMKYYKVVSEDLVVLIDNIDNIPKETNISEKQIDNKEVSISTLRELTKYDAYVVFDTETSGLYPDQGHEILQLGAIKYDMKSGKVLDTLNLFIKPSDNCVVEKEALLVNGLKITDLKENGVPKYEAMMNFINFVGSCPLVAYNAPFDLRFLIRSLEVLNIGLPNIEFYDVLPPVRELSLPIHNNKLATVASYYGYDGKKFHDALKDCDATNYVLRRIVEELNN